jgi:hypothetical protein
VTNCHKINALILLLSLLFTPPAISLEVLTSEIDLNCSESDTQIVACSYRQLLNQQISDITARIHGQEQDISIHNRYPTSDSVTAIFFVIDTSDPGRQNVIEINSEQIVQLISNLQAHHIAGLASFDKDLVVRAPINSNRNAIVTAARSLEAAGLTTELYRNTIKAIEVLARVNADRKVLFLFSDGQAEDKAYYHADVINVARRHDVVINSLGFARSTPLSVSLQTLRRLSEETGGMYFEANTNFELPNDVMIRPLANIDRGGQFIINLDSINNNSSQESELALQFLTSTQPISVTIPVNLPITAYEPQQALPTISTPLISQPQAVVTVQSKDRENIDYLLWYGLPSALIVLILLTLATLYMLFKKESQPKPVNVTYAEVKPLAYLISQDEKASSYPVTTSTWRIGRSQDNEMTINDSSISRRHAEINRESNGQFVLYDRGSTNGVYINNKIITKQILSEGDIIEIGDFFLRFTEHPKDFQYGEDTAMLKTRAPKVN